MHLYGISFSVANNENYPYPSDARRLYNTLGMTALHAPSVPRLIYGYSPFHEGNEIILRQTLENLKALSSVIRSTTRPRSIDPIFTFPPENIDSIREVTIQLASLLLDERMFGYIVVALKRISRLCVWRSSIYSEKSWQEIDQALCKLPSSTTTTPSPLRNKLSQVSQNIGFDVDIIIKWIHLFVTSRASGGEQFILDIIDDHDLETLIARVQADETALLCFSMFYPSERLMPYNMAYRWFRDLWFRRTIGSLTEDASKWLKSHQRKKRKGWLDGIRWSNRRSWNAYC